MSLLVPPSSLHSSNDLPSILLRNTTVLFADDTTIYIVSDSLPTIQSSLQLCLANIWLQTNGLRINAAKTKSMLIHSSRKVDNLTFKIDNRTVESVRSFKFLEMVVNDTLTWVDHIDMVCKKVSRSLNLLRRLSWFLPQPLLLLYLKSYILPHFDYCDVVWIRCTKAESLRLESLLNFVCQTVLHRCKLSSASAACCELGLSILSSKNSISRKLSSSASIPLAQLIFPSFSPPPAPPTALDLLPLLN